MFLLYIALMRNHKSIGFNYTYILLYLTAIIIIFENNEDFNFFLENKYFFIVFLLITIIISINEIIVDREGITKKFYLFPIKIKVKTWREIKFYVEVDEEYSGRYGKTIEKCFWFVDKNDKVCLRIKRALRYNFQEVLDVIDKYEEKAENKLKIDNPYLMSHGWTKVNEYIKIKDKP
jgi:magnesium-transporting ATPase (P-type)